MKLAELVLRFDVHCPGRSGRHALHADQLAGCTEISEEARELVMIAKVLEAYECKRWPDGKVPGGKG